MLPKLTRLAGLHLLQVKDLSRGAFGFVVLALDRQTGEHVALKFIERGPQHINKYVEREVGPASANAVANSDLA